MSKFAIPALKVTHRLVAGFVLSVILFATAATAMVWDVNSIIKATHRINAPRTPTVATSAYLTNSINGAAVPLTHNSTKMTSNWRQI